VKGFIEALTLGDVSVEIAVKENLKDEYKDYTVDLALLRTLPR
jgi:hypothetical protein